jgi:cell wall-associated NlpC family hydrolase
MPSSLGGLGGLPGAAGLWGASRSGSPADPSGALDGLFGRDGRGSATGERAVAFAKSKLGLPYVWGAKGPRAYDCSGLVQDSYAHAGISLPRMTYDQIRVGVSVGRGEIRAGDLVFSNFSSRGPEHVQLAVSPSMVIEAPTPGGHVQFSSVPSGRIVVKRVA